MKNAQEQLSTYKSVHLNPSNIKTHFVGIPLIIASIVLLLSLVSLPLGDTTQLTLAQLFFIGAMIYYIILRWSLAIGLFLFLGPLVYVATIVSNVNNLYLWAIGIFVVGWVMQFIGHHFEKAKPAFVEDLNQLMIGPFFLMAELYFMLGFEKQLEEEITPMAIEKRRILEVRRK